MSETHQIDPQQRAEAIRNVKSDANQVAELVEGFSKRPEPPEQGIVNNINNKLKSMDKVLPYLVPNDPVHARTRATWKDLEDAWDAYFVDRMSTRWVPNQTWKDCAERARVFAAVVFALQ
jgi:hypothetical protein